MYTRRKHERGQSLIEAALTFPLLLLILSAAVDLGRVFYFYIALEEAAAEGAAYLAINPECPDSTGTIADPALNPLGLSTCDDPNNALWRTINATNSVILEPEDIILPPNVPTYASAIVSVRIDYQFDFITPGLSAITQNIQLRVEAANVVLGDSANQ